MEVATTRADSSEVADDAAPRTISRKLVTALIAVALVGLIVGAVGLIVPSASGLSDGSSTKDRRAVTSTTADFASAMNTYDVADLDDYRQRTSSLLTPSYKKEFEEATQLLEAVKQKEQVSKDANVLSSAVQTIDSDSAIVLVAVDTVITNTNTDSEDPIPRRFRWKVSLVKDGEVWKVDNNESIAALEAETTDPVEGEESE